MTKEDSGVYAIRNRHTMQTYVGRAKHVTRRWYGHRRMLEAGSHHCKPLQSSWDAWGADSFEWIVMHSCPGDCTRAFEWWAIQLIPPVLRLNSQIVPRSDAPRHGGIIVTPQARIPVQPIKLVGPDDLAAFFASADIKDAAAKTGLALATIYRAKNKGFKGGSYKTFDLLNKYMKAVRNG